MTRIIGSMGVIWGVRREPGTIILTAADTPQYVRAQNARCAAAASLCEAAKLAHDNWYAGYVAAEADARELGRRQAATRKAVAKAAVGVKSTAAKPQPQPQPVLSNAELRARAKRVRRAVQRARGRL